MPGQTLMTGGCRSGQAYVGAFLKVSAAAGGSGSDGGPKSEGSGSSSAWPSFGTTSSSSGSSEGSSNGSGEMGQGSDLGSTQSGDNSFGGSGPSSGAVKDSDIHQIGTFCQVHHISELEGGQAQLLLLGHRRLKRLHTVRPLPVSSAVFPRLR